MIYDIHSVWFKRFLVGGRGKSGKGSATANGRELAQMFSALNQILTSGPSVQPTSA